MINVSGPVAGQLVDPTVKNGTLQYSILLRPGVLGTKCGTPLIPTAEGWQVGTPAVRFAAEHGVGGEMIGTYKTCVVEVHTRTFTPGKAYKISEVDAYGGMTWDPPDDPKEAPVWQLPPPPAPEGQEPVVSQTTDVARTVQSASAGDNPRASRQARARQEAEEANQNPSGPPEAARTSTGPGDYLALDDTHLELIGV
jgi:hypothetical protein